MNRPSSGLVMVPIMARADPVSAPGHPGLSSSLAPVSDYPKMITPAGHVEPVPRRVRAMLGGEVVLDTTGARYVWEWPNYPQYYIPLADVHPSVLVDEQHDQKLRLGTARRHGLRAGDISRPGAARV